jgi:hypothetical protein
LAHRADDDKLYETRYYNTEAVLAVGVAMGKVEAGHFERWLGVGSPS